MRFISPEDLPRYVHGEETRRVRISEFNFLLEGDSVIMMCRTICMSMSSSQRRDSFDLVTAPASSSDRLECVRPVQSIDTPPPNIGRPGLQSQCSKIKSDTSPATPRSTHTLTKPHPQRQRWTRDRAKGLWTNPMLASPHQKHLGGAKTECNDEEETEKRHKLNCGALHRPRLTRHIM